jgi:L-aspartate oxidase
MRASSRTDFIVVGAGVAGLRAAIALAEAGRVLVLAKQELTESATQYAQGGIAVVLSDEDQISLHLHDTIVAGDGLVNERAARVLVEEGPERIQELIAWGTEFDRQGTKLTFTAARGFCMRMATPPGARLDARFTPRHVRCRVSRYRSSSSAPI